MGCLIPSQARDQDPERSTKRNMKCEESDAWILLATNDAQGPSGARLSDILLIADGINHAVPTGKELNDAFKKLKAAGLIEKKGKAFFVTPEGKRLIDHARKGSKTIIGVWRELYQIMTKDD
jgi:hypothetical protein